jgi:hypothetical protein
MRVRDGYDLRHVVAEYRAIRSVILRLYREQGDISEESRPKLTPLAAMDAVLDNAIATPSINTRSIKARRERCSSGCSDTTCAIR